jgi:hypothetical protein
VLPRLKAWSKARHSLAQAIHRFFDGSEFVHMDYGEAIQALERANEKFEFPGQLGRPPAVGARALSDRKSRSS